MKKKIKMCPHCGAKMVEYKHSLNIGLVKALIALYEAPGHRAQIKTLHLTHNQHANFQKLRYWNLVEMLDKAGTWAVTTEGEAFVTGCCSVFKQVTTYRGNPVKDKRQIMKAELTSIKDFFPTGYKKRNDYINDMVSLDNMRADTGWGAPIEGQQKLFPDNFTRAEGTSRIKWTTKKGAPV